MTHLLVKDQVLDFLHVFVQESNDSRDGLFKLLWILSQGNAFPRWHRLVFWKKKKQKRKEKDFSEGQAAAIAKIVLTLDTNDRYSLILSFWLTSRLFSGIM